MLFDNLKAEAYNVMKDCKKKKINPNTALSRLDQLLQFKHTDFLKNRKREYTKEICGLKKQIKKGGLF